MFNLKEFILENLINGVKKGIFAKEYASTLAVNYMLKGILTTEDIERFDNEAVYEEPVVEESIVEGSVVEETVYDEVLDNDYEENYEDTNTPVEEIVGE